MYISIYLYAYVTYSMHALFPRSRIDTIPLLVFVCAKNVRKGTWIHHYYAYSIHHTCFFRIGCGCCCCFRVVSTIWNPCKMHQFVSSTPFLDFNLIREINNFHFSTLFSKLFPSLLPFCPLHFTIHFQNFPAIYLHNTTHEHHRNSLSFDGSPLASDYAFQKTIVCFTVIEKSRANEWAKRDVEMNGTKIY